MFSRTFKGVSRVFQEVSETFQREDLRRVSGGFMGVSRAPKGFQGGTSKTKRILGDPRGV